VESYAYDADGFLTSKTVGAEITRYQYSSQGELLRVDLPDGSVVEYAHDPLGRRVAKSVNGTVVARYLWQGLTRLLAVYGGDGSLKMRFEYADGRLPAAMSVGGERYYPVYDQVGSLRALVDGSGAALKVVEYDGFGNVIADDNAAFKVPFGFAGGLYDKDANLVRFGHRDYDPDTGRWTAKDPIRFAGGDTDLYGYVLSDPVNWVDPAGLFLPAIAAGAAAIGGSDAALGALAGIIGGGLIGNAIPLPNYMPSDDGAGNQDAGVGEGSPKGDSCSTGKSKPSKKNPKQDKKLTDKEVKDLIKAGHHPHTLKDNARQDLFKDDAGNVLVKPKDGSGPGEITGVNLNDIY